jgi:hypothetical protein
MGERTAKPALTGAHETMAALRHWGDEVLTDSDAARTRIDRSGDVVLDMRQAGDRIGYSAVYLPRLMKRDDPPPLFRVDDAAAWRVWQSDLDAWMDRRRRRRLHQLDEADDE